STDNFTFTQIDTTLLLTTTYVDKSPAPNRDYYRIRSSGLLGDSGYSNVAVLILPPAAPSNLSAAARSSQKINLNWVDNSTNEDGFKVYRSIDGVNFTWVHSSGANTTVFEDTHTSASTTYYYQVTAFNTVGDSGLSNTASVTTMPLPVAPSNLTASAISSSSTKINWTGTANSADDTAFTLYRSPDSVPSDAARIAGAKVTAHADTARK